ncbi:MAG: EamA family transporter [Anaerolineae bacterium]|nr:EamA family transporter [Anaerolineae bacterium]
MTASRSPHLRAVLQALCVTLLWSTSWVLIKFGLEDIPALTFAGLRYTLAFACLLPVVWRSGQFHMVRHLTRRDWQRLAVLGVLFYSVTQGTQFLGLDRLPAVTTSLLLSFTTVVVALLGIVLLSEYPTRLQWGGVALYLLGVLVYFYPVSIPTQEVIGLLIVLTGVVTNSLSTVFGRGINREGVLPAPVVTVVSMGIGSLLLLIAGIAAQGLPALSLANWTIIGWLAVVNTAFAFTLWNHTQRTLSAVESSIINNTMLIQIAMLAWVFLDESLGARAIVGLALAGAGTLIVQLRRGGRSPAPGADHSTGTPHRRTVPS